MNNLLQFVVLLSCFCAFCFSCSPGGYTYSEDIFPASLRDLTSNSERDLSEDGFALAFYFFVDNDSALIAFQGRSFWRCEVEGGEMEPYYRFPSDIGIINQITISPDRKKFVLSGGGDKNLDLYLLELDGFILTRLTNTPEIAEYGANFSRSNDKIVFASQRLNQSSDEFAQLIGCLDLAIGEIDTVIAQRHTIRNNNIIRLFYSPNFIENDERIVYLKVNPFAANVDSIISVDLNTLERNLLSTEARYLLPIKISSASNSILFFREGNSLAMLNSRGAELSEITSGLSSSGVYNFSPDGTSIAYRLSRDTNLTISKIDGSNQIEVGSVLGFAFSKDGKKLAYTRLHTIYYE